MELLTNVLDTIHQHIRILDLCSHPSVAFKKNIEGKNVFSGHPLFFLMAVSSLSESPSFPDSASAHKNAQNNSCSGLILEYVAQGSNTA